MSVGLVRVYVQQLTAGRTSEDVRHARVDDEAEPVRPPVGLARVHVLG